MNIKKLLKFIVGAINLLGVEKLVTHVIVGCEERFTFLSLSALFNYLNECVKHNIYVLDFFVIKEYDSLEKRLEIKIYLK